MTLLEIVGVAFGLVCVWLTTRQNIWCWPTGIVNVLLFFVMFLQAKLYADAGLQVVYLGLSIYGWWLWLHPRADAATAASDGRRAELPVTRMTPRAWVFGLGTVLAGTLVLGSTLARTDASFPWADSATTCASLLAQWLMSRKVLESWLVWIVADIAMIAIYLQKDLLLTSGLYVVYMVLCVVGYRAWRRTLSAPAPAPLAAT